LGRLSRLVAGIGNGPSGTTFDTLGRLGYISQSIIGERNRTGGIRIGRSPFQGGQHQTPCIVGKGLDGRRIGRGILLLEEIAEFIKN